MDRSAEGFLLSSLPFELLMAAVLLAVMLFAVTAAAFSASFSLALALSITGDFVASRPSENPATVGLAAFPMADEISMGDMAASLSSTDELIVGEWVALGCGLESASALISGDTSPKT